MPRMLLSFILERQRQILNRLRWEKRKREKVKGRQEGAAQHQWRTTQPYDFSQRSTKAPLFGSDPASGPFMDYAQTRSIRVPPIGYNPAVPKPTLNRGGSIANLRAKKLYGKSVVQETRRKLPQVGTDIKPARRGGSPLSRWDGQVRSQRKPSYLTSRRKEVTVGDRIAKEMMKEPYSFFT